MKGMMVMRDVGGRRRVCVGQGGIQHNKCNAAAGGCSRAVARNLGRRVFSPLGLGILGRLRRDRHPLQLLCHLASLWAPLLASTYP